MQSYNPVYHYGSPFGLFPLRSSLLRESQLISLPWVLRYFSSPGVHLANARSYNLIIRSYLIRKPSDQSLLTAPRGVSHVYCVLHRNMAPRHPLYALKVTYFIHLSLTSNLETIITFLNHYYYFLLEHCIFI